MSSHLRSIRLLHTGTRAKTRALQSDLPSNFFRPSVNSSFRPFPASPSPLRQLLRRSYSSSQHSPYSGETNTKILYGIIGINVGVWAYYKYTTIQLKQGIQKPVIEFARNFTLSLHGFKDEHRWWTLLTSCFTHFGEFHLLGNMLSIYYMGELVARTPGIGPQKLITLIIGSGLAGSVGYLTQREIVESRTGVKDRRRGLGFSGAVMGVGTVAACMYPSQKLAIYGIIPVPLWLLMGGYAVYDGFYVSSENTNVGHAGHLGGLAFGLVYYLLKIRGGRF